MKHLWIIVLLMVVQASLADAADQPHAVTCKVTSAQRCQWTRTADNTKTEGVVITVRFTSTDHKAINYLTCSVMRATTGWVVADLRPAVPSKTAALYWWDAQEGFTWTCPDAGATLDIEIGLAKESGNGDENENPIGHTLSTTCRGEIVANPTNYLACVNLTAAEWSDAKKRRFRFWGMLPPDVRVMESCGNDDGTVSLCLWGDVTEQEEAVARKKIAALALELGIVVHVRKGPPELASLDNRKRLHVCPHCGAVIHDKSIRRNQ